MPASQIRTVCVFVFISLLFCSFSQFSSHIFFFSLKYAKHILNRTFCLFVCFFSLDFISFHSAYVYLFVVIKGTHNTTAMTIVSWNIKSEKEKKEFIKTSLCRLFFSSFSYCVLFCFHFNKEYSGENCISTN